MILEREEGGVGWGERGREREREREKERERERNINVKEKHLLVASPTGDQTHSLSYMGHAPTN